MKWKLRSRLRQESTVPNPFPGMDPYLEMQPFWSDFSPTFLGALRDALLPDLLPRYDVRIEEYVLVTQDDVRLHRVKRDVTIAENSQWQSSPHTTAIIDEPASAELDYPNVEPDTQRRLNIIHLPDQQVVTVMELLSPANKQPGADGFDAYLDKRTELIASSVNFVEIDLLRGGQRMQMRQPLPPADYYIYIGRAERRPSCQLIYWPLRMVLPKIPIPLLPEDEEAELDLGAVCSAAYEPALYDRRLPYDQPLRPRPSDADRDWIHEHLAAR